MDMIQCTSPRCRDWDSKVHDLGFQRPRGLHRQGGDMANAGKETLFSLGEDTPLAVLSTRPHTLYDYFKQRFAQVTQPRKLMQDGICMKRNRGDASASRYCAELATSMFTGVVYQNKRPRFLLNAGSVSLDLESGNTGDEPADRPAPGGHRHGAGHDAGSAPRLQRGRHVSVRNRSSEGEEKATTTPTT